MRDQSPNRRLAKAGLVIRWLTARPNAMYGSFARNTLSCSRGAIGAAVISSWKGAIAASSADDDARPAAGRLGTAAPRRCYGCRRPRDVMAITEMSFRGGGHESLRSKSETPPGGTSGV